MKHTSSTGPHVKMEHRLVPELTANIYYTNLCVYNCDTFGVRVWRFFYRNKHTCDLCCYLPNMGSRAALDTIRLSDRSLTNVGETGLSIGFPLVTDYTAVSQNFFLTLNNLRNTSKWMCLVWCNQSIDIYSIDNWSAIFLVKHRNG